VPSRAPPPAVPGRLGLHTDARVRTSADAVVVGDRLADVRAVVQAKGEQPEAEADVEADGEAYGEADVAGDADADVEADAEADVEAGGEAEHHRRKAHHV
jgi:hypothetical protein